MGGDHFFDVYNKAMPKDGFHAATDTPLSFPIMGVIQIYIGVVSSIF